MYAVEMPRPGKSVVAGSVQCWAKIVGDPVARDETLAYIETNKINLELPAPASGFVRAIFVQEGEPVAPGTIIALIGAADEPLPDPAELPRQPVAITRRPSERFSRSWFAPASAGWMIVLLFAFLALFAVLHLETWLATLIIGVLLAGCSFLLGIVFQKWRAGGS